jgi:hypothetical protein
MSLYALRAPGVVVPVPPRPSQGGQRQAEGVHATTAAARGCGRLAIGSDPVRSRPPAIEVFKRHSAVGLTARYPSSEPRPARHCTVDKGSGRRSDRCNCSLCGCAYHHGPESSRTRRTRSVGLTSVPNIPNRGRLSGVIASTSRKRARVERSRLPTQARDAASAGDCTGASAGACF